MASAFDAFQACDSPYISSHVHIVPNVLPGSLNRWPRKSLHLLEEGQNHPIRVVRFAYLCRMIGKEPVVVSLLYMIFFSLV